MTLRRKFFYSLSVCQNTSEKERTKKCSSVPRARSAKEIAVRCVCCSIACFDYKRNETPHTPPQKKKSGGEWLILGGEEFFLQCQLVVLLAEKEKSESLLPILKSFFILKMFFSFLECGWFFFNNCISNCISPIGNFGCFPWRNPAATVMYLTYGACWVFYCFHNPWNSDMDCSIFNMHFRFFNFFLHVFTHGTLVYSLIQRIGYNCSNWICLIDAGHTFRNLKIHLFPLFEPALLPRLSLDPLLAFAGTCMALFCCCSWPQTISSL